MPYIIAVILLVVASVGFTLFHSANDTVAIAPSKPLEITATAEEITTTSPTEPPPTTATSTSATSAPPKANTQLPLPTETPSSKPVPEVTQNPTPATDYKNGSYRTQTSYRTPGGTYLIDVTISIANDKVTAANVAFDTTSAGDGYSKRFSQAYQGAVIGQDLGTVSPSRIGGSSLTTQAFNTALKTIKTQAQS